LNKKVKNAPSPQLAAMVKGSVTYPIPKVDDTSQPSSGASQLEYKNNAGPDKASKLKINQSNIFEDLIPTNIVNRLTNINSTIVMMHNSNPWKVVSATRLVNKLASSA
jgi:hypothetical protein